MSASQALPLAVLLLLLNAFFVGAEFALVSARRTQIEPRVASGSRAARVTLHAMENVSLVMAGAQLGITACSLALGALGEPAVAHLLEPLFHRVHVPDNLLHPLSFAVALTIVVCLHVVIGEMVPKNFALADPTKAALVLGPPMMLVVTLLRPVVTFLNGIANLVLRGIRVTPREEVSSAFTHEEVAAMVEESRDEGVLEGDEYDRLAGALGFVEKTVAAVLLPLPTLVSVAHDARVGEVERICADTGFSRFPVTGPDGSLLGYLHIQDVLDTDPGAGRRRIDPAWVHPFVATRPTDRLHEALGALRRRGAHMGVVVDAENHLLGVVTLEDILEELVGEIRDAAHAT